MSSERRTESRNRSPGSKRWGGTSAATGLTASQEAARGTHREALARGCGTGPAPRPAGSTLPSCALQQALLCPQSSSNDPPSAPRAPSLNPCAPSPPHSPSTHPLLGQDSAALCSETDPGLPPPATLTIPNATARVSHCGFLPSLLSENRLFNVWSSL